jgi:hypothetical protein
MCSSATARPTSAILRRSRLKSRLMLLVVSHDAARSGVVRRTKERSEWSMVLPKPFAVDEGLFKKCALPTSVHDLQ